MYRSSVAVFKDIRRNTCCSIKMGSYHHAKAIPNFLGKELKVKSKNGWGEPNKKVSNKINSYVLNDEKLSFVAKNKVAVDFMGLIEKGKSLW